MRLHKIIAVLLLIAVLLSFSGCNEEDGLVTVYLISECGSEGASSKTFYEYDESGNLVVYQTEAGHRYEYQYDETGNKISTVSKNKNGDCSIQKNIYDENGRCLQGFTFRNGIEQSRSEYKYDESGNMTTCITYSDNIEQSRTEYEYDASDNLTRSITYSSDKEISRTEYSYDDRGNKVLMICYKGNAETSRDEYIYNFANQMTKRISYHGAETTTYICEYDRNGCLIKSNAYGEINGRAYTTAEITYRYIKKRMSLEKAQKLKAEAVHSNFYVYIDN